MITQPSDALAQSVTGYSARVELELWVDGECIRLAQVSHDRVKPRDKAITLVPSRGELVVIIDGERQSRQIEVLPDKLGGGFFPVRDRG